MTTSTWKPPAPGVLDDTAWPEKLVARAVQPGTTDDRLHGYEVLRDVGRNYRYADLVYLAITGELPDDGASALFHVALCSFATLAVNEAPAHVGVLSRICGGTVASALGAGALTLAEQAHHIVTRNEAVIAWFATPARELPQSALAEDADERAWVQTLRDAAPTATSVRPEMSRDAARLALLHDAGIRDANQLEAAIVMSRMNGLVAEVLVTGPRDLGEYPVKLPPFQYVEDAE
jgi:hypothetical protein